MKRFISLTLACLLLAVSISALAAAPTTLQWLKEPEAGDTDISFNLDPLGSYFFHIWIVRNGVTLGYFNSGGSQVAFQTNNNFFSLINDTDVFTKKGFLKLEYGDVISLFVGERGSMTISKELVTPPDPDPAAEASTFISAASMYTQGAVIVGVREWANVRSGPSADSEVIGRAYLGEPIQLITWSGEWVKILYNGNNSTGWVNGQFVE